MQFDPPPEYINFQCEIDNEKYEISSTLINKPHQQLRIGVKRINISHYWEQYIIEHKKDIQKYLHQYKNDQLDLSTNISFGIINGNVLNITITDSKKKNLS